MIMDDAPPPTDHVLRPHHIALLSILMMAFKDLEIKSFPSQFALHIHQTLLTEIAEVAQPKAYQELMSEICGGEKSDAPECFEFKIAIKSIYLDIVTADKMGNFLGNVPCLFLARTPDENPRFTRRSIFGYFSRRCYVSFLKLSFAGLVRLCQDYQAWCAGDNSAGYAVFQKDQLNSDLLIHRTQADKKSWAKPDAFQQWEKGQSLGDENIAAENLRRFFEQHFHENNDSGVRQHALLNLVRMHYVREEYVAARKLLSEAITVARTSNDRITLHHCTSILRRLPQTIPGQKPVLHEIQPDLHPLEVLYDVSKLLDEQNDQPLSAAFIKIFQAVGLYDHWLDVQFALPVEDQQWAQHAIQSIIWNEAGCDKLSTVEGNIVMAFTEPGGESTNRLSVILNKTYKNARQGNYNEALAMLLDPSVWRGLSIRDYSSWAHQIWHILALRATRRGQFRMYREFLLPQRPAGLFDEKEYLFNVGWGGMSTIRESLYQILHLRQHDQALSGVEHLLRALWHSEFLCRFNFYRTGIILLADVGLEFGMSKRSRQILEEIIPQVINGEDLEQRAVACLTFARCIILAGDSTPSALREALPYVSIAEVDFRNLEIFRSMKDAQYLLSIIYHNLGMENEGNEVAVRCSQTEQLQQSMEKAIADEETREIFDLQGIIGAALAAR